MVRCPINEYALAMPDQPALIWAKGTLTYKQLDLQIEYVRNQLLAHGITKSDRVAIVWPNSWQYVILMHALFRVGAVAVPISTRFPQAQVDALVKHLECRDCMNDPAPAWLDTGLIAANASEATSRAVSIDADQDATVLFSSGSTGLPKAILHCWGNHYWSAIGSNENIVLAPGDRWLLSLPLYHVAGVAVMFRCFAAGAAVVVPDEKQQLLDGLIDLEITHVSMVGTQLLRLLDQTTDGAPVPTLKSVLLGGSAIPSELLSRAHAAGWPIHTSYGMTEMSSQVTATAAGASLNDLYTSGRLLKHRELKIDVNGQILVRGKTRFKGILADDGLKTPFDDGGWYATGDLGKFNDLNQLQVLGRKDNMFISGGENIHPEEIERVLERYTGIQQAIVVPVADKEFGARPVAFLQVDGNLPDDASLRGYLALHIARFMMPVAFFPMPASSISEMKISRQALVKHAVEAMRS